MITSPAKIRRPPGPDSPVALGIDADTLQSLQELQRSFGNIACVSTPTGRLAYFVNEPAAIHQVLVKNHSKYIKGRDFQRVKMLLSNGLFVSDGATWRRSRTMVQPGFKTQSLNKLIRLIVDCARRQGERWGDMAAAGEPINITKEMTDYALEVILRAIFGNAYDSRIISGDENPFAFLSEDSARDLQLVLKLRALRNLVLDIVNERRNEGRDDEGDFLSLYMSAKDKDGKGYSDQELLDELMTLVVAGFETSAGTMNWAWYLISGHPDVDEKIVREARELVPDVRSINSRRVSELTYLGQVLDETLRIYPPGWIFSRRAVEQDSSAGYEVPVGTDVYISPYILHRTDEFWEDPDEFDPDRFAATNKDEKSDKRLPTFIPFSLGSRRCIGEYFAILEMKIQIALLLQQFRMARTSEAHPGLELGINLRSGDDIYLQPSTRS